jgi:ribosomal protein S18 acetylase RimI-like enzyme
MLSDRLYEIEAAAVRGWPALSVEPCHGWLCRHTSGGSLRANSVATLAFDGPDPDAAIAAVERFYARRDALPLFTICDVSRPADLDARLAARGYRQGDDHLTMAKPVAPGPAARAEVTVSAEPSAAWTAVYLTGLSPDHQSVAPRLIAHMRATSPNPPLFFTAHANGSPISSGLSIVDGSLASVQCMATLPGARRSGGAQAVLAAIERHAAEHHAHHLYLQTSAKNAAARALYERAGFAVVGRYWTRTAPALLETPR